MSGQATLPRPVRAPAGPGTALALRTGFGLLFVWCSGVHVGIVSAHPQLYRHVADGAWFPGIRWAWQNVFMGSPAFWGLAVAVGELAIGALLLAGRRGGPAGRAGLSGAVGFHVGLMLLGWGFWMWAVPALALLARAWTGGRLKVGSAASR